MKAKILLLGLCALSLAACSVDETKQVNDANSVAFKATVPYATRAAATTANSLGSFSVWAWTGGSTFMNHVTATNNGSGTYTTSPLYFWPTTSVDFLGLSPAVDGTDGEYVYIGGKYESPELGDDEGSDSYYTGHVAAVTPGATTVKDSLGNEFSSYGTIMVDVPSSYEDQIDLCYAVATGQSSGKVAMNFRHALSQVVFAARTTSDEWGVEINGVSVCSVYKTGQYALPQVSTATNLATENEGFDSISGTQGMWTLGTAYGKSSFHAGVADTTVPTDGTSVTLTTSDGALFLIPQEVAQWDVLTDSHLEGFGSYFRINCKVTENGATLWPNSEETDADSDGFAEIAIPVDVAWEEGCKYTYTFVFGDGLGYYPPDDPNHNNDLDGTPVLVPISFTVSVDEFQKTEEAEVSTDVDLSYIKVNSAADLAGAVHMGYQTIEIEASTEITLTGYLEFNSDCTLILGDGSTLTGPDATVENTGDNAITHGDNETDYSAIIYVNGCNLTIEGEGTVATGGTSDSDYTNAIWVVDGTVTVYGGTFKGSNWNGESASSNYVKQAVYCGEDGYAYIYGGNFYAGKSTHPATYAGSDGYAWVLNCHNSSWEEGRAMIYCYGGTYYDGFDPSNLHVDDAPSYVATGYWSVYDDGNNCYTVEAVTSPASVSTATNLRDAVNAGASEITVTADVDLLGYLEFNSDCTLTIESGVTVTCPNAVDGDNAIDHNGTLSDYTAAIYVNGCNVTIESNGTVGSDGTADACHTNAIWVVNGSVTVNGGTFKGSNWNYAPEATSWSKHAVYCGEDGYAYLNGGTYSCGYTYVSYAETENGYWVLNCHNSSELSGHAMIYCTGGSYLNFDPSNPGTDDATSYVAEGYTVTSTTDSNGTWYTVSAQ